MNKIRNNPTMTIKIRRAVPKDVPFIKNCLIDSWVDHARNNRDLMTEERMRNSKIEVFYKQVLRKKDNYILIAEVEEKQVGLIRAYEEKIASFFIDNKIIYIDDIYVARDFRRKGIARKLISEIESIAKQMSIKRIDGRVYSYNLPIEKLLSSMGYHSPYATWVKILK